MPHPSGTEDLKSFTKKFMSDPVMVKDYPDIKQRYAIMLSVWKKAHKGHADIESMDDMAGFASYCGSDSYAMAASSVGVNGAGVSHARSLIKAGHLEDSTHWVAPSADSENAYWDKHGESEYAKWFLGVDTSAAKGTKGRYKFPYGDFTKANLKGLKAAKSRAAQAGYGNIEKAADSLIKLSGGDSATAEYINLGEGTNLKLVKAETFDWETLFNE